MKCKSVSLLIKSFSFEKLNVNTEVHVIADHLGRFKGLCKYSNGNFISSAAAEEQKQKLTLTQRSHNNPCYKHLKYHCIQTL